MAFTSEQLQAINATGKNITVAASAGSGKTTVLVERIMKRVLQDKVPLDKFLAMTFTEAAASEMKSRLFARLNEVIEKDESQREYCKEQLVLLSKAQISTIHSFCLSVIQENYAYIGFDLQRVSTILSPEEEQVYFKQAFMDTMHHFEVQPAFIELKQNYTSKVYDNFSMYQEIQALASMLKEQNYASFYQFHEHLYTAKSISQFPALVQEAIFQCFLDYLTYLEEVVANLLLMAEDPNALLVKKNYLETMKQSCLEKNYAMFKLNLHGFVQIPFPPLKGDEIFKKMQEELRKIEDILLSITFEEALIIHDLNAQWPLIKLLIEMAAYYNQQMEMYKATNLFMDFDDMELYAFEILSNHPEVADLYKQRFIDILVDEYQDSSKHQDQILSYITRGNNIFRVGDVKQSIYRFRNATPDLLKGYIENPKEKDQVIFLCHNFRSNSQIINFVNNTFQDFMNQTTFQSNFAQNDIALVGSKEQMVEDTCIEYHVIKADEMKEKEELEDASATRIRAEYIASEIARIHELQKCKWNDFVVLVRSNERKIDLKRAFHKYGIPNFIDSKEGFYKSEAVTYITSFIDCVIAPYVDNYFVALALSPFYNLTNNDLARFTLDMRSQNIRTYYEYATSCKHPILNKMVEDLRTLRYMHSLRDKLCYMYNVNQYYDTYTSHNDRTNLDSLLEKACSYELSHSDGLEGFSSFIASLKDFKSSEALSINSKEDVVRVMTVHQSKGLQFAYVFYWGKEKANKTLTDKLVKHDVLGLSMDYLDVAKQLKRPSILTFVSKHLLTKADIEEEIRVIYVALTRPKSKLIMTTLLNTNQFNLLHSMGVSSFELLHGECYGKWLLKKCMGINNVQIREISSINIQPQDAKEELIQYLPNKLETYSHLPLTATPSSHAPKLSLNTHKEAMKLGTMMHHMLEVMDFTHTYTKEELFSLAKEEFVEEELVNKLSLENLMKFQANSFTCKLIHGEMYREYPLLYVNNGQIITAVIDLFVILNKELYIIDYKSDIAGENTLMNAYHKQLEEYQKIISEIYPNMPIHLYIYSLHLSKYLEVQN